MTKSNPFRALREALGRTQQEMVEGLPITRSRWGQLEGSDGGALGAAALVALVEKHGRAIGRLGLEWADFALQGRSSKASRRRLKGR
jgi:hypothetical protein